MGNSFKLVCNSCGSNLRVGSGLIGRTVPCPKCDVPIQIQDNAAPPVTAVATPPEPARESRQQVVIAAVKRHLSATWPTWLVGIGVATAVLAARNYDSEIGAWLRYISAALIGIGAALPAKRYFAGRAWRGMFTVDAVKSRFKRTWPAWCISAALIAWFLLIDVQSSSWFLLRYVVIVAAALGISGSALPAFAWSWKRFGLILLAIAAIWAVTMDLLFGAFDFYFSWWIVWLELSLFVVAFILAGIDLTLISSAMIGWFNRKLSIRWTRYIVAVLTVVTLFWWAAHDTYVDRWTSKDDTDYADTYKHWSGDFIYRRTSHFHKGDSTFLNESYFWSSEGPMAGTGKPHGHWITEKLGDNTPYHKDEFYWYGEEISEGQWYMRNK
ncbi:MAG TPA: hypothetical protein VFE46_10645 [Pirellulales bacterium]|jgi:hypothetical protein|nr:hypothetical protein [Pirellulales bacterium]